MQSDNEICKLCSENCKLSHRRTSLTRPFLVFVTGNLQFRSPKTSNSDTISANVDHE